MTDEEILNCNDKGEQLARLRALVRRLREPGGCPWDAEQSHESLIPNLIEEVYEVVGAIRSGDWEHVQEELGDVLLQVVFHADLAREAQRFDLDEVARGVCEKLIRRHPHVFSDAEAQDSEAVLRQWDEIKKAERKEGADEEGAGYLSGVGRGLPPLLRAMKLQKRAAKVGFDWPEVEGVMGKVREELAEVEHEISTKNKNGQPEAKLREELGDLLFATVNLARHLGANPEEILAEANGKFEGRFHNMERCLRDAGKPLGKVPLAELEEAWQKVKKEG